MSRISHLSCAVKLLNARRFSSSLEFGKNVRNAMEKSEPIVCLESTIITHGMPYPQNLHTALRVQDIIKEQGAIPATVGILNGRIKVGLSDEEIKHLAQSNSVKVSRRDLPYVLSKKLNGGTTVAATMIIARMADIPVFVTGGIGGVHRGGEASWDVSADLMELGRTPVAVVCSGVKSILDIGKTLEVLETQGVGVTTLGLTEDFPAFYCRKSNWKSPCRLETIDDAVAYITSHRKLKLESGLLIAVPVPEDSSLDEKDMERAISSALALAEKEGVVGPKITPFVLKHVADMSKGKALAANIALIENNAKVGAQIAVGLKRCTGPVKSRVYSAVSGTDDGRSGVKQVMDCDSVSSKSSSTNSSQVTVIGGSVLDLVVRVTSPDFKKSSYPNKILDPTIGDVTDIFVVALKWEALSMVKEIARYLQASQR